MTFGLIAILYIGLGLSMALAWAPSFRTPLTRWLGPLAAFSAVFCISVFLGPQVQGLEYEDAYVAEAAALWRTFHLFDESDGFYSTVCLVGSASDCFQQGSFGTQTIGFPTLIAAAHMLVGYSSETGNALSSIAAIATMCAAWGMLKTCVPSVGFRFVGATLPLAAPAFLLLSSTGFAEPLFASLLMLNVYVYVRLSEHREHQHLVVWWMVFALSGALMMAVKKEGVLAVGLVGLSALIEVAACSVQRKRLTHFPIASIAIAFSLFLFATFVLRIFDASERHSADIGEAAFQLANVPKLLPVLASAAMQPSLFGIIGPLFVLATIAGLALRDCLTIRLAAGVCAYVLLYASHTRHGTFASGGNVEPWEMARYLYTLAPLAVVVIARGGYLISMQTRGLRLGRATVGRSAFLASCGALGVLLALWTTFDNRTGMAADEQRNRIGILQGLAQEERARTIFLTPYSAAIAATVGPNAKVIDTSVQRSTGVNEWLALQLNGGNKITIDPRVCSAPERSAWQNMCDGSYAPLGTSMPPR